MLIWPTESAEVREEAAQGCASSSHTLLAFAVSICVRRSRIAVRPYWSLSAEHNHIVGTLKRTVGPLIQTAEIVVFKMGI
jgi:hypothetical protein